MKAHISKLEYKNKVFTLSKPLVFDVKRNGATLIFENDTFHLQGCGKNQKDVMKSLNEDFAIFYEQIVLEKDENLKSKTLESKRQFLKLVESVVSYSSK